MTAGGDRPAKKPRQVEAARADFLTRLCRRAGVELALGLAGDLLPLNRGVQVGETASGPVFWVERAGMALEVRGAETEIQDPYGGLG